MSRRSLALWAASLGALCVSASAIPGHDLFARQSSCAPSYNQCKNDGFPDTFCCPANQYCIPLAGNTTLLCCPTGAKCDKIKPLPCDISLQDGTKNPDAVVKTTALGGTLGRCGNNCCPFGYSCSNNNDCVRDKNQDAVPIQSTTEKPGQTSTTANPTESATKSAETSSTPDTTNPAQSATTTDSSSDEASGSSGPPIAAIAGGATAGAVLLIGAIVLAFIFLRKKKNASEKGSPLKLSRSTSSFGNLISNPIMGENTAIRTDFARHSPRNPADDPDPESVTGDLIADSMSPPGPSGGMLDVPAAAALQPERQSNIAYGYGGPELQQEAQKQQYYNMPDMPHYDYDSELPPRTPRQDTSSMNIAVYADKTVTPDATPQAYRPNRNTNTSANFNQMVVDSGLGDLYPSEGGQPPMPSGRR